MTFRHLAAASALTLALAGCGASGPVPASSAALDGALSARAAADAPFGVDPQTGEPLKISPDDAVGRATKKALAWQPDARLVAVAWGVAKFQTTSVCYHVFHSPKAGKLLKIESKLVSFWQNTEEITDKKFTWPAKVMGTLEKYPVSAEQVLAKVREAAGDKKPVSLLVLTKANPLVPPLWWVVAEKDKMVVDAKTGKVWLKFSFDVPNLPFF